MTESRFYLLLFIVLTTNSTAIGGPTALCVRMMTVFASSGVREWNKPFSDPRNHSISGPYLYMIHGILDIDSPLAQDPAILSTLERVSVSVISERNNGTFANQGFILSGASSSTVLAAKSSNIGSSAMSTLHLAIYGRLFNRILSPSQMETQVGTQKNHWTQKLGVPPFNEAVILNTKANPLRIDAVFLKTDANGQLLSSPEQAEKLRKIATDLNVPVVLIRAQNMNADVTAN